MNLLYPPRRSHNYKPKLGKSGLWYCGRKVMNHDKDCKFNTDTDGYCGPNNGANCTSCRVLYSK